MAKLKTKQGEEFTVDDDLAEDLSKYIWVKYPSCRYIRASVGGKVVSIHRYIMKAPKGSTIDHINGDRMDNRRCNLRFCNHSENMCNTSARSTSKSGYKGVHQLKNGKFRAKIDKDGKRIDLGVYASLRDAVIAYSSAAKVLHGEFAYMSQLPPYYTQPGYKLVPIEPTDDMLKSAWDTHHCDTEGAKLVYSAMIEAAK